MSASRAEQAVPAAAFSGFPHSAQMEKKGLGFSAQQTKVLGKQFGPVEETNSLLIGMGTTCHQLACADGRLPEWDMVADGID